MLIILTMNIGIDLDYTLVYMKKNWYNNKNKLKIRKSAKKYLPMLAKQGFLFHIITGRKQKNVNKVYEIIKYVEHNIGIKFVSINFTNGNKKGYYAHINNCSYMIDDSLYYLMDCDQYGVNGIIYGKNIYNIENFNNISSAISWKDISTFLLKKSITISLC